MTHLPGALKSGSNDQRSKRVTTQLRGCECIHQTESYIGIRCIESGQRLQK